MKASQLIKQLEHCIKKAGDRDVVLFQNDGDEEWVDVCGTVWPADGVKHPRTGKITGKGRIIVADRETMEAFR